MWHVTCDTWHVTCDTWREVNILSKCWVSISYGLGVKVFWRYLNKRITYLPTELISDKGACRTAPAITGLLRSSIYTSQFNISIYCIFHNSQPNQKHNLLVLLQGGPPPVWTRWTLGLFWAYQHTGFSYVSEIRPPGMSEQFWPRKTAITLGKVCTS